MENIAVDVRVVVYDLDARLIKMEEYRSHELKQA